jgi:hypothetical protein
MFDGQVETTTQINLLYDDVSRRYHVIRNLTGALAKRFVCKACNKACKRGVTHNVTCRVVTVCQVPICARRGSSNPL